MPLCNLIGHVHSLESFGSVDGPGVRFVVFLQGCALRCKYCHNPETWACEGGEEYTPEALFQKVYRYRNYWGKKGGVTVSGGEPLRQMEFLTAFFQLARKKGVHTALDTAGQPFRPEDPEYLAAFDTLMASTSLVILDLKEIDPEKHRQLTGKDNANILAMARMLALSLPVSWRCFSGSISFRSKITRLVEAIRVSNAARYSGSSGRNGCPAVSSAVWTPFLRAS